MGRRCRGRPRPVRRGDRRSRPRRSCGDETRHANNGGAGIGKHHHGRERQRGARRLGGLYYSVAKAAAIHLTRYAAVELGEKGIRINTISPGPIATGIFGKAAGLDDDEADANPEYAEAAIATVLPRWQPLPHVGHPDDIAQAALFLASGAARLVTGHNLVVDGGICAGWPAGAVRDDITLFPKTLQERQATHSEVGCLFSFRKDWL
jgi:NAD(P)-dependent dehydrogenase (short-subunit alcohol dehydrogenase family)